MFIIFGAVIKGMFKGLDLSRTLTVDDRIIFPFFFDLKDEISFVCFLNRCIIFYICRFIDITIDVIPDHHRQDIVFDVFLVSGIKVSFVIYERTKQCCDKQDR